MYDVARENNILTGEKTMEPLASFKDFPVFIGCTNEPAVKDLRATMDFDICKTSGFIQLRRPLDPQVVYSGFHSEALGSTWEKHHQEFAAFVGEHDLRQVLEIGGSTGAIAKQVLAQKPALEWTIVEPNPADAPLPNNCRLVKKFFDASFVPEKPIDAIVHSHTLEHLYDPVAAIRAMQSLLPSDGWHIFSVPNLLSWLTQHFPNALNFEHTYFLTEEFIEPVLEAHGFVIRKKQYFGKHSIFYATQKISAEQKKVTLPNRYAEYKKLFQELISYYTSEAEKLTELLSKRGTPRYLFGAHIFSQYLLYYGLSEKFFAGILDNSTQKQGKRLYGFNLTVEAPSSIAAASEPSVVLRAGVYNKEITEQLKKINPKVTIL